MLLSSTQALSISFNLIVQRVIIGDSGSAPSRLYKQNCSANESTIGEEDAASRETQPRWSARLLRLARTPTYSGIFMHGYTLDIPLTLFPYT